MYVNLIELLKILQLITIQKNFDGRNIKSQAIKRLVKYKKNQFLYTRLSKVQLRILSSALECPKNNTKQPLAQNGCAHLVYIYQLSHLQMLSYIQTCVCLKTIAHTCLSH